MSRRNQSLLLFALGVPGLAGSLTALPLRGAERWSPILVLGAVIMWGLAIFLTGLMSLFGTRRFLRNAASAKGHVSDIYEATPVAASDYLFPGRIVTVQFWTEQEESIAFRSPTLRGNPETAAGLVPVLYDPNRPAEAKIRSFEGLWFTSGLVMVMGAGWSLLIIGLLVSVLR